MNRLQREPWLELAGMEEAFGAVGLRQTTSLCQWCRYAVWYGGCCEGDLVCQHPNWRVADLARDVWQGEDCPSFRPSKECQHPLWRVAECGAEAWQGKNCWGFRPSKETPTTEHAVDLIGGWLQQMAEAKLK